MTRKELIIKQREAYYKRYNLKKFSDWASPHELCCANDGEAFLLRVSLDEEKDKIQDFVFLYEHDDSYGGMSFEHVDDVIVNMCQNDCYRIKYLTIIDIDTYVNPDALVMRTDFNPYIEFYQAYEHSLWDYDDITEALST